MLRILWKWLAASFSVVVILLAVAIGVFRIVLPLMPQYHEKIEAFASEAAGTPVRIEGIDARWGLAGPELRFTNAELLTANGSETLLSASRGSVVLDLGRLVRKRQLQAGQILLDGLRLEVVRDAERHWQIGGRSLPQQGGDTTIPRRLSVGLREAEVVFRDEVTGAGPWLFDDVDLNVDLQRNRLRIDGLMRLPEILGGEIELSLETDGDLAAPADVDGQIYLRGSELAFAGWHDILPADKLAPRAGSGDLIAWVGLAGGEVQQASLQFDLRDVELERSNELMARYDVARGRIEYDQIASGWRASGRDIVIAGEGGSWPATNFAVEQVGNADGLFYADVGFARLQDIVPLADWISDRDLREKILGLSPRGTVEDLSFRMTRTSGQIDSYSLRTDFLGLGIDSGEQPGFDNLQGDVRLDAYGGRVQLDPGPVVLDLPRLFSSPVEIKRLDGTVVWRRGGGGWRIVSDNISLDHQAFVSSTSLEVALPPGGAAPTLDLNTQMSNVDIAAARALIPDALLAPELGDWLRSALVDGNLPEASVTWSGAVDQFPFDDGNGRFKAIAELNDVDLVYARNWPAAENLNGTLSFENASWLAGISGGEIAGNRVSSASVSMADLRRGVLELDLTADGMLDDLHSYLLATPLIRDSDSVLRKSRFSGPGSTEVDITLPLRQKSAANVVVTVSTEAGSADLDGVPHGLEQIEGVLTYRNGDMFAEGIAAQVLGAPIMINIEPQTIYTDEGPRQATVAIARGVVSDQELAQVADFLPRIMTGSTPFTATVTIPEKAAAMPVSVEIATQLDGMAITLPAPVGKRAATPVDFAVNFYLPRGGMQTDFVYPGVGNARVNWIRDAGEAWVLDRGGIHFGTEPATLPPNSGLAITGAAGRLQVDKWLDLDLGATGVQGDLINSVRLQAQQLEAWGQVIANGALEVSRSEREWLVQVDSDAVSGGLFIPFAGGGPIIANMERLYFDFDGDVGGNDDEGDEGDPGAVPEIDLQADDFRFGEMKIGSMSTKIRKSADGIVMQDFVSEAPTFAVTGSGAWRRSTTRHSTRLDLKLISTDLAPTLASLGFDETIDSDRAEFDLALSWPGPPGRDFKSKLDGAVKVRIGSGQLRAVQPGAGRVFGLLSFMALPRRLSLDFRDVFDKGFGFDYIEGDFTLDDGDAFTSNLVLEGPAAQVGIAGRAGLVARDYDQTAVVFGNFGAALPVAGVLAGGPVIGGAMLIFSELFKKPLQDMARIDYRITGSWDEPQIERVLAVADNDAGSS